MHLIILD